jgi:hypothetical protein
MIVTSYTRLVLESHQSDCRNALSGLAGLVGRRSSSAAHSEAYREREGTMIHLGQPTPLTAEVTELVHVASRQIHGAA